jgi:4-oxalocrotonate tautomerase
MPHVTVKLYAGRSEQQKQKLADELAEAVTMAIGSSDSSISVAVVDIDPEEWLSSVYESEIKGNPHLYKLPGYKV